VLVIDQDAVFVATETYGEVIKTRTFEDFCTEQDLKLWVCHKADPESKGPIENSVGFVKKNFFSARNLETIDDVWRFPIATTIRSPTCLVLAAMRSYPFTVKRQILP
jgi:transposase